MEQKLVQKQNTDTKLALKALQMTYSLHELKEYLMMGAMTIGGVVGRIALQGIPSVEPITFFAVLAGSVFGKIKGAMVGAFAWFMSNYFIFGGQGPWTIIQVAGGLLAGYLGGFCKGSRFRMIGAILISTLAFEILMNLGSSIVFGIGAFFTAIPFALVHLVSNAGFGLFLPYTQKLLRKFGRIDEKKLCKEYMECIR